MAVAALRLPEKGQAVYALTVCQPTASRLMLPDDDSRRLRIDGRFMQPPDRVIGCQVAIYAARSRPDDSGDLGGLVIDGQSFGAVVGTAILTGGYPVPAPEPDGNRNAAPWWALQRWPWIATHPFTEGPWAWVLRSPRPLPEPIPWEEKPGLWEIPDHVFFPYL